MYCGKHRAGSRGLSLKCVTYMSAHLGCHWEAKDKAAGTAEEGDRSLPRL